jgi:hypothetical protein
MNYVNQWRRCNCGQCRARALMGPVMLVTLGVLFLVGEYSRFSFGQLWPIILIAAGAVKVAESLSSSEGHVGR